MNKTSKVLALGVVVALAIVVGGVLAGVSSGPKINSPTTASEGPQAGAQKPQNHVINVTDSVSVGDRQ